MDSYCIVYVSEATVSLSDAALRTLLRQARAEHEHAHLTGFLLYHEGCFLQVLEGVAGAVREFFGRIAADPRHCKVEVLADGLRPERDFSGWHMCFPRPAGDEQQLPGYLPLPALLDAVRPTPVQPLLSEFLTRCHAAAL